MSLLLMCNKRNHIPALAMVSHAITVSVADITTLKRNQKININAIITEMALMLWKTACYKI